MALIAMCCYDTEENQRSELTRRTLECIIETGDLVKHRLIVVDNNSCKATSEVYKWLLNYVIDTEYATGMNPNISIIGLKENVGTAEAINQAIRLRRPGESVIKLDNDIIIHSTGWVEKLQEAIDIDNNIGVIGLKRRDLIQSPWHPDPQYRSEMILLPHEPGQRWVTIEKTADIIGSCTMFNYRLLDKVGYLRQPGKYGFEDNLLCHRAHLAGFYNCFLNHIDIEHIDPGDTPYQIWKEKHSGEMFPEYHALVHAMIEGKEPIYYNPFETQ